MNKENGPPIRRESPRHRNLASAYLLEIELLEILKREAPKRKWRPLARLSKLGFHDLVRAVEDQPYLLTHSQLKRAHRIFSEKGIVKLVRYLYDPARYSPKPKRKASRNESDYLPVPVLMDRHPYLIELGWTETDLENLHTEGLLDGYRKGAELYLREVALKDYIDLIHSVH